MDFDLSQVSDNAPTLFNSSSRNSSDGNRISDNRFDSTNIVGSVYHDNAEKLHSDLIGIEEEPINYQDVVRQDGAFAHRVFIEAYRRGLWIPANGHIGISSAHSRSDIDTALSIIDDVLQVLST